MIGIVALIIIYGIIQSIRDFRETQVNKTKTHSETKTVKKFPVLCAWCKKRPTIIGWSTVEGSHGVCRFHEKELERQIQKLEEKAG